MSYRACKAKVAITYVILRLAPDRRNSKRQRFNTAHEPTVKRVCACLAGKVWNPGFILVADRKTEVSEIGSLDSRRETATLLLNCVLTANVAKVVHFFRAFSTIMTHCTNLILICNIMSTSRSL